MDEDLRQLFRSKAIDDGVLNNIQAADSALRTVADLAAGAESEQDARQWAEELGLAARVLKGRFVQTWLEARSKLSSQVTGQVAEPRLEPEPLSPVGPTSPSSAVKAWETPRYLESQQRLAEEEEAVRKEQEAVEALASMGLDGDSGPFRPPAVQPSRRGMIPDPNDGDPAIARRHAAVEGDRWARQMGFNEAGTLTEAMFKLPEEETFSSARGLSDQLRKVLRAKKVTAVEVSALERSLEYRTVRDLGEVVESAAMAQLLAREAGINSKVSQENFAFAWQECRRLVREADRVQTLPDALSKGDFDACTQILMKRIGTKNKADLVHMLRKMLKHMAQQHLDEHRGQNAHVLPALAAAYGAEVAERARQKAAVDDAEWRWRWTLRALFAPKFAVALQKRLLLDYRADHFQASAQQLSTRWKARSPPPNLEEKMQDIEVLCLDRVLTHVLPGFGFTPNKAGVDEMRAAITQHLKGYPEVRQLQVDISSAVMSSFKI